jgi:hypothetical protein
MCLGSPISGDGTVQLGHYPHTVSVGADLAGTLQPSETIPLVAINATPSQKSMNKLPARMGWAIIKNSTLFVLFPTPFPSLCQKTSSIWRSVSICPKPNANAIINHLYYSPTYSSPTVTSFLTRISCMLPSSLPPSSTSPFSFAKCSKQIKQ